MAIDEQNVGPATGPEAGERSPAEHRHRRLAVGSVLVVLALCGVLRSITADAHLPWQHHWDEATNVTVGQRMSDDLSIDPGFYDYPALVFVTQAAVLVPATLIGGYAPTTTVLSSTPRCSGRVGSSTRRCSGRCGGRRASCPSS